MNTTKTKNKINLIGLSHKELADFFISIDEKPFRATQIIKWIHQRGISDISEMTDLSKSLREKLLKNCEIKVPDVVGKNRCELVNYCIGDFSTKNSI